MEYFLYPRQGHIICSVMYVHTNKVFQILVLKLLYLLSFPFHFETHFTSPPHLPSLLVCVCCKVIFQNCTTVCCSLSKPSHKSFNIQFKQGGSDGLESIAKSSGKTFYNIVPFKSPQYNHCLGFKALINF